MDNQDQKDIIKKVKDSGSDKDNSGNNNNNNNNNDNNGDGNNGGGNNNNNNNNNDNNPNGNNQENNTDNGGDINESINDEINGVRVYYSLYISEFLMYSKVPMPRILEILYTLKYEMGEDLEDFFVMKNDNRKIKIGNEFDLSNVKLPIDLTGLKNSIKKKLEEIEKNSVNETDNLFIEPKKNNMFQPGSNDKLNIKENLEVIKKSSTFDIIKVRLKETFNQDTMETSNNISEPNTKPIVKPSVKPETKPSRKNKPFLPMTTPGVNPDPKAKI